MLYDFLAVKGNNWAKVNEDKLCGRQSEHKLKGQRLVAPAHL